MVDVWCRTAVGAIWPALAALCVLHAVDELRIVFVGSAVLRIGHVNAPDLKGGQHNRRGEIVLACFVTFDPRLQVTSLLLT